MGSASKKGKKKQLPEIQEDGLAEKIVQQGQRQDSESPVPTQPLPKEDIPMQDILLGAAKAVIKSKVIAVVDNLVANATDAGKHRKTLGELNNVEEETYLDVENLHKTCSTGDLLMTYSTTRLYGWYAANYGQKFDKVMMIVKNANKTLGLDLKGTYVIEPVRTEKTTSSGGKTIKYGYRIVPLNDIVERVKYAGHGLMYRSLHISEDKFVNGVVPKRIEGKSYMKDTPKEMLRKKFGIDTSGDNPSTEGSWSAMLIAYALVNLGVMQHDISWFMLSPSKFGHLRNGRLEMGDEAEDEEDVILST